jgi:hypothetical protein
VAGARKVVGAVGARVFGSRIAQAHRNRTASVQVNRPPP